MTACGDLKSSCHKYLLGRLSTFLVKKKLLKIKYGSSGSISNSTLVCFSQTISVGCSEISISVIVEHVQHHGIIRDFCLAVRLLGFSVLGEHNKLLG